MLLHKDVVNISCVFPDGFEDVPIIFDRLDKVAGNRGIRVNGVCLWRCQWERNINHKESPQINLEARFFGLISEGDYCVKDLVIYSS